MRTYGQAQCNTIKSQTGEAKLGSTYYDLESVAYQIAAYTGSSTWNACANEAEIAYRTWVEGAAADGGGFGAVSGYWNFPDGLRRDFELTADARSKEAVKQLSLHASYCRDDTPIEWSASATMMRETAYCINSFIDAEALGAAARARRDQMLTQLLDHLDATITLRYKAESDADVPDLCKGKTYAQPFYLGLALKTLIEYENAHHDARILPMIKRVADFMWSKLRYQPTATSGRFWYGQCSNADNLWNVWTSAGGNLPADDLNLLYAPAWAYLYAKTGDVKYRDQGDQIWSTGVIDATLNGLNSKQFNQNYFWSFDYVKLRNPAVTVTMKRSDRPALFPKDPPTKERKPGPRK